MYCTCIPSSSAHSRREDRRRSTCKRGRCACVPHELPCCMHAPMHDWHTSTAHHLTLCCSASTAGWCLALHSLQKRTKQPLGTHITATVTQHCLRPGQLTALQQDAGEHGQEGAGEGPAARVCVLASKADSRRTGTSCSLLGWAVARVVAAGRKHAMRRQSMEQRELGVCGGSARRQVEGEKYEARTTQKPLKPRKKRLSHIARAGLRVHA